MPRLGCGYRGLTLGQNDGRSEVWRSRRRTPRSTQSDQGQTTNLPQDHLCSTILNLCVLTSSPVAQTGSPSLSFSSWRRHMDSIPFCAQSRPVQRLSGARVERNCFFFNLFVFLCSPLKGPLQVLVHPCWSGDDGLILPERFRRLEERSGVGSPMPPADASTSMQGIESERELCWT